MIDAFLMTLLSLAIFVAVISLVAISGYLKDIFQTLTVIGSIMIEMKDKKEKK